MIVFTLGLPGSASTWLQNVVAALMARSRPGAVALFAETSERFGAEIPAGTADVALKAHSLDRALARIVELGGAAVIVTVRDPRDGVVSLVERFGRPWLDTIRDMGRSLATIGTLAQSAPLMVLRYEDGFAEDPATVGAVAARIGLPAPYNLVAEIARDLSHDGIRKAVAAAPYTPPADGMAGGVFLTVAGAETRWHRGHVGDGQAGKWETRVPEPWRSALNGCFDPFVRDPVSPPDGPVRWDPVLFSQPGGGDGPREWELSGSPRMLAFGPYINLPTGRWTFAMGVESAGLGDGAAPLPLRRPGGRRDRRNGIRGGRRRAGDGVPRGRPRASRRTPGVPTGAARARGGRDGPPAGSDGHAGGGGVSPSLPRREARGGPEIGNAVATRVACPALRHLPGAAALDYGRGPGTGRGVTHGGQAGQG